MAARLSLHVSVATNGPARI